MNMTPPAATKNIPTCEDMLKIAADFGALVGKGKDVQIQWALKLVEAAYLGALTLDPNRHGNGIDDATQQGEAYAKAQNAAVIFDKKANNQRKLISNTRKALKLGSMETLGSGEPLNNVIAFVNLHQKLNKTPGVKTNDIYNAFLMYATAQIASKTKLITGTALEQFCLKRETDPRTAQEVIEAIKGMAEKLTKGKVTNCPDSDTSNEVHNIISNCTQRLAALAKAKGTTP